MILGNNKDWIVGVMEYWSGGKEHGLWTMDRGLSMDYGPWTKDWSDGKE